MLSREALAEMLEQGLSLEEIGRRVERHPSTVSYWLKQHGLDAANAEKHANLGVVDELLLCELVADGLSGRQIAHRLGRSLASVRHWLTVYGLETVATGRRRELAAARAKGEPEQVLNCPNCGPSLHRQRTGRGYVCLRCRAESVARHRRKVKSVLVAEAGGACAICGYAESLAALQFHHVDPSLKEFHIGERGVTRSIDRARAEAAKCVLLCANCHAAVECGDAALP